MKDEIIGYCSVDSGQILLTDPCYLGRWKDNDYIENGNVGEYSYTGACLATLSKKGGGELKHEKGHSGAGVVVETYSGDGRYPVTVKRGETGRIIEATIHFD